jgi:sorbitol-specific phosphotransferase system component IIBC
MQAPHTLLLDVAAGLLQDPVAAVRHTAAEQLGLILHSLMSEEPLLSGSSGAAVAQVMGILGTLVTGTEVVDDGSYSDKAQLQSLQRFATAAGAFLKAGATATNTREVSWQAAVQCMDNLQQQLLQHPPEKAAQQAAAADMMRLLRECVQTSSGES